MIVKLVAVICNEEQLKDYFDVEIGTGKTVREHYKDPDEEWTFPCIIYEVNGEKWFADIDDYLYGLLTDEERREIEGYENE